LMRPKEVSSYVRSPFRLYHKEFTRRYTFVQEYFNSHAGLKVEN